MNKNCEPVVLLSADRHPIGLLGKQAAHGPETPFHLAFSCYRFDPAGRVGHHAESNHQADVTRRVVEFVLRTSNAR
jgi:isopentenyldiphosphate isomerase